MTPSLATKQTTGIEHKILHTITFGASKAAGK